MEESFIKIPKALFSDEYSEVSPAAKLLYGFLLERNGLSLRNNWRDKENEVYVYFTQDEIKSLFKISGNTASRLLNELEKSGLVLRNFQGIGRPNKIKITNAVKNPKKKQKRQTAKNYESMVTYDLDEIEELFNSPLTV